MPEGFDGALVTNEFPIYEVIDPRLDPEFLSLLLRSRYYQRAFRAITTGHSNRRRTQWADFEALEVCFPSTKDEQRDLIQELVDSRSRQRWAVADLNAAMLAFSAVIDGRGDEELPDIDAALADNGDGGDEDR